MAGKPEQVTVKPRHFGFKQDGESEDDEDKSIATEPAGAYGHMGRLNNQGLDDLLAAKYTRIANLKR